MPLRMKSLMNCRLYVPSAFTPGSQFPPLWPRSFPEPTYAPVNAGYVGSGNDLGHSGGNCEPGVNADGTYNLQFINDFIRNGIKEQILFSKAVAARYYGAKPAYNYWNGCSTGGRQGYLLAQELGEELDGILANAPAIYWTRFQTAQMWGQIVMKDLLGGAISAAKLNQATASAVAACDAADGVTDGIIDDPRTGHFSATANICGAPTAPATNCLTLLEARAIDMRGRRRHRRSARRRDARAAFQTELRGGGQLSAAVRAADHEAGAALQAKFRLRRVLVPTRRTLHQRSSRGRCIRNPVEGTRVLGKRKHC